MANPVKGTCVCPLCAESGAEVREGVKGRLYIVCDGCVTMTTTMSRQGRALIENRLGKSATPDTEQTKATAPAPAPAAAPAAVAPKPAPAPAPKKATVPSFFGLQPS